MIASPVSDEEAVRRTREYYVQRIDTARQKHENRVKGLEVLIQLDDGHKIEFRGRKYGVPPVPWPLTLKTLAAKDQVAALIQNSQATLAEWDDLLRTVARIFVRIAKAPDGSSQLARFLWPLRRIHWRLSPAAGASIPEVVQVLSFFCVFLNLDGGLPLARSPEPPPPGTSPSTPPRTPETSRSGATKKAGRVVGSIS